MKEMGKPYPLGGLSAFFAGYAQQFTRKTDLDHILFDGHQNVKIERVNGAVMTDTEILDMVNGLLMYRKQSQTTERFRIIIYELFKRRSESDIIRRKPRARVSKKIEGETLTDFENTVIQTTSKYGPFHIEQEDKFIVLSRKTLPNQEGEKWNIWEISLHPRGDKFFECLEECLRLFKGSTTFFKMKVLMDETKLDIIECSKVELYVDIKAPQERSGFAFKQILDNLHTLISEHKREDLLPKNCDDVPPFMTNMVMLDEKAEDCLFAFSQGGSSVVRKRLMDTAKKPEDIPILLSSKFEGPRFFKMRGTVSPEINSQKYDEAIAAIDNGDNTVGMFSGMMCTFFKDISNASTLSFGIDDKAPIVVVYNNLYDGMFDLDDYGGAPPRMKKYLSPWVDCVLINTKLNKLPFDDSAYIGDKVNPFLGKLIYCKDEKEMKDQYAKRHAYHGYFAKTVVPKKRFPSGSSSSSSPSSSTAKVSPIIEAACRLVICQRINHNQAETLCQNLLPLLNTLPTNRELFERKLGPKKAQTCADLLNLDVSSKTNAQIIDEIAKIKGIGPWTVKWLRQEYNLDAGLIFEDLEVRKGLGMTLQDAKQLAKDVPAEYAPLINMLAIQQSRKNDVPEKIQTKETGMQSFHIGQILVGRYVDLSPRYYKIVSITPTQLHIQRLKTKKDGGPSETIGNDKIERATKLYRNIAIHVNMPLVPFISLEDVVARKDISVAERIYVFENNQAPRRKTKAEIAADNK